MSRYGNYIPAPQAGSDGTGLLPEDHALLRSPPAPLRFSGSWRDELRSLAPRPLQFHNRAKLLHFLLWSRLSSQRSGADSVTCHLHREVSCGRSGKESRLPCTPRPGLMCYPACLDVRGATVICRQPRGYRGSVPDRGRKASIAVKSGTRIF